MSFLQLVPFILAALTGICLGRRLFRQDAEFDAAQRQRIASQYLNVISDEIVDRAEA